MNDDYKWTYVTRDELYHSPAWNNLEETKRLFPQCVEMGERWGADMIQNHIKQSEDLRKHPEEVPGNYSEIDAFASYHKNGEEYMCIEYQIALHIFNEWYGKTDEFKNQLGKSQKLIDNYYDQLIKDPHAVAAERDSIHENYQQWWTNQKIKEAERRTRR